MNWEFSNCQILLFEKKIFIQRLKFGQILICQSGNIPFPTFSWFDHILHRPRSMPKSFAFWMINWAVSVWPLMQAQCKAVLPLIFLAFRSMSNIFEFWMINWAVSVWPFLQIKFLKFDGKKSKKYDFYCVESGFQIK